MKRPGLNLWQRLTTLLGWRYVRINFRKSYRDDWRVIRVVSHGGQDCAVVPMARYSSEVYDALTGGYAVTDQWTEHRPLSTLSEEWEWLAGQMKPREDYCKCGDQKEPDEAVCAACAD